MNIGCTVLDNTAALAPMAGMADRAFREICVEMGACYVVGEMASSKGLVYGSSKTAELLGITEPERPMAVQLFGDDPDFMAKAVDIAARFSPNVIDINMGCPAPKITLGGAGSALLKNLPLAEEIIRAVAAASPVPVTVKLRKGWDDNSVNGVEAAVMAEGAGACAVTVHGRTRVQMYAPPVDLDIIRQVKGAVSIPVIGNGDVDSVEGALRMYSVTGCDLVMIGRGALGKPWLFRQIKSKILRGINEPEPELDEKLSVMLDHIARAVRYKGEYAAMREARSHAACYLKGMLGAAALRRQAGTLAHYEDLEKLVRQILIGNG